MVLIGMERAMANDDGTSRQSSRSPGYVWACTGSWEDALFIGVVPGAEHCFATVEVATDAVQVDHAAAANLDGWEGVGLNPAANHVRGDQVGAEHIHQHLLRAERRVAEIGYALGIPLERKPHYTRLFHVFCPIIRIILK